MPTLNWLDRDLAVTAANAVPFQVLVFVRNEKAATAADRANG